MPDQAAAEHKSSETTVSKSTKKKTVAKRAAPARIHAQQDVADLGKVGLEDLEPGSAQWRTKKKILADEAKRKKLSVVVDQWIEYHHTNASEKGGKCLLKKQMANGNVYSFYLGRLRKGGAGAIQAFQQKGVRVTVGAEHFKKTKPVVNPE